MGIPDPEVLDVMLQAAQPRRHVRAREAVNHEPDLPGTAAGSLIAAEAGAVVTDVNGDEWSLDSDDIVITAPGTHAAMLGVLSSAVAA